MTHLMDIRCEAWAKRATGYSQNIWHRVKYHHVDTNVSINNKEKLKSSVIDNDAWNREKVNSQPREKRSDDLKM